MARRKKRAWNMSNPLYRYLHGKSKKVKVKVKHKRRSAIRMARRRARHSKRSIMSGAGVGGLAKSALIGIGTAHLSGYVPVNVPFKEELAGAVGAYLVGGKNVKSAVVGAGAVYLTKMISGNTSQTSVSSSGPYN